MKNTNNMFITFASENSASETVKEINADVNGFTTEQAEEMREKYGNNEVNRTQKHSFAKKIFDSFVNPFTAIIFLIAVVSVFTDIVLAEEGERNFVTVTILSVMVLISGILRFVQETRSSNAAGKLSKMIETTACVLRDSKAQEIPISDIVVGDIVRLSAGDMIPADLKIIFAKDLFVSQSALTGESEAVEKFPNANGVYDSLSENPSLAFMGSNVISGSATGVVCATGNSTMLGEVAKTLNMKPVKTSFEKGINSVSWLLIRFMLVMVPIVLLINGFTKGDWISATLFAISVAVGLTPEMLPMIVTTCLAKGAVTMSNKKVIIKNLNSIQNLGAIDVLCTDKTGTLTQDKVVLEYHLDVHGNENVRVLRHAFLNSYFQTGLKNLMDVAIIERTKEETQANPQLTSIENSYTKVDEIPFDFDRRRMSVVVADKSGKTQMITKGAVEEMLSVSSFVEYGGNTVELSSGMREIILEKVNELNSKGMRVIAVAQKTNPSPVGAFSIKDEQNMVLIGYLAFLDPPKDSAAKAIKALNHYGVGVKVLTGDNEKVTACVCKSVGIPTKNMLLGSAIDKMNDSELKRRVEITSVFAKLSPSQKARVVTLLRENGHTVGFMGDGINDTAAMKCSDVGISVDTAVDIAKESADVILLEKDLTVLENGLIEGRKTYCNMIKYIKMTASSNFGNMLSVLVSSVFLPFFPMVSLQIIFLNLIYDISCIAIPWDNVDEEFILKPRKWEAISIAKFMLFIGPVSSIFDIITYGLMFFIICPMVCGCGYSDITNDATKIMFISVFQAGWFVESMWSQSLVIHMIRTPKIPFIQSRASFPVMVFTLTAIGFMTFVPFTILGSAIGLSPLPPIYFAYLIGIIVAYLLLATVVKNIYVKHYGELL